MSTAYFSVQDFIRVGVLRDVNDLIDYDHQGTVLNLGAGNKPIPGTIPLDLPDWNAEEDHIPYEDRSVAGIWALHFFEHVSRPIEVLWECQRVLRPGGVLNIVVPFYTSSLHHSDLDHKHTFSEATFKKLFRQHYWYSKNKSGLWEFDINFNLIIGVEERNMCVFTQLVKQDEATRVERLVRRAFADEVLPV